MSETQPQTPCPDCTADGPCRWCRLKTMDLSPGTPAGDLLDAIFAPVPDDEDDTDE